MKHATNNHFSNSLARTAHIHLYDIIVLLHNNLEIFARINRYHWIKSALAVDQIYIQCAYVPGVEN